jgi:hypothetical protein
MGGTSSSSQTTDSIPQPGIAKTVYRGITHRTLNKLTDGEKAEAKAEAEAKAKAEAEAQKKEADRIASEAKEKKEKKDAEEREKNAAKQKCLQDPTYRFPTPKKDIENPIITVDGKKTDMPHQISYINDDKYTKEHNIEGIVFDICYEWAGNKSVIDFKLEGTGTAMDFAFTFGIWHKKRPEIEKEACNIIKYLIAAGADIDATNGSGDTPLHEAVWSEQIDLVNHIIKAGANVDIINKNGETPLIIAIKRNKLDIVTALIEKADVNIKNTNGKTPLDIARYNSGAQDKDIQNKIIELLRTKGAQATTWLGGSSKKRKMTKRKSNKKQRKTKRNKRCK